MRETAWERKPETVRRLGGRFSRRVVVLVAVFAGVVIGGTAAWWGFPPTALAYTCNGRFSTDATRTYGLDFIDRGVRASTGDLIYGGGATCVHVASVLVIDRANDWVEVGWHTMATGYADCHATGNNVPVVFYLRDVSGQQTCYEDRNITIKAGTYYPVSVRSDIVNNANRWIWDWNGTTLSESPDLGFSAGAGMTNSDRHYIDSINTSDEDATAHFKGMQKLTSANSWVGWGGEICAGSGYNNDAYYNNQLTQPDEVGVSTNAAQC